MSDVTEHTDWLERKPGNYDPGESFSENKKRDLINVVDTHRNTRLS